MPSFGHPVFFFLYHLPVGVWRSGQDGAAGVDKKATTNSAAPEVDERAPTKYGATWVADAVPANSRDYPCG